MSLSTYVILVISGLIPSFVWLFYFLKRDPHPEPRSMIAKTFLMGIIVSVLALALQLAFAFLAKPTGYDFFMKNSFQFFLWAALVEESVKYLAVRLVVLRNPAFDEPVDAMIYMIVSGLGFAAIENILYLFNSISFGIHATFTIWALRSVGSTLLHALSSSIVGYFLALSWFARQHHSKLLALGIVIATLFHFSFNLFLTAPDGRINGLMLATGLLLVMAFLVSILFVKIKSRHQTAIAVTAANEPSLS